MQSENQQLKAILGKKDADIKELKEEILGMDKELKIHGGGKHSWRLEFPVAQKKSHRIKQLDELSQNAINQA
jgi:hypothetical protein